MADAMSTPAAPASAEPGTTKYHPIRGAIYGLLAGIGLAIYLIILKVINLGIVTPIIVIVASVVLGVLWGRFAPARRRKRS